MTVTVANPDKTLENKLKYYVFNAHHPGHIKIKWSGQILMISGSIYRTVNEACVDWKLTSTSIIYYCCTIDSVIFGKIIEFIIRLCHTSTSTAVGTPIYILEWVCGMHIYVYMHSCKQPYAYAHKRISHCTWPLESLNVLGHILEGNIQYSRIQLHTYLLCIIARLKHQR